MHRYGFVKKLASDAGLTRDLLLAGLAAHLNHPSTVNRERFSLRYIYIYYIYLYLFGLISLG